MTAQKSTSDGGLSVLFGLFAGAALTGAVTYEKPLLAAGFIAFNATGILGHFKRLTIRPKAFFAAAAISLACGVGGTALYRAALPAAAPKTFIPKV
jgi:hypothetical protein